MLGPKLGRLRSVIMRVGPVLVATIVVIANILLHEAKNSIVGSVDLLHPSIESIIPLAEGLVDEVNSIVFIELFMLLYHIWNFGFHWKGSITDVC
jgi:hypothetical protein